MGVFGGYCSQIVPNLGHVTAATVSSESHFTGRVYSLSSAHAQGHCSARCPHRSAEIESCPTRVAL